MKEKVIIEAPILKPRTKLDNRTKSKLLSKVNENANVIVHCSYVAPGNDVRIRIWKSTFLNANGSSHKSKLVHAENITVYPIWMIVRSRQTIQFTLIFTGLPKSCTSFDLIEDIPETGGFVLRNIERNTSDVYRIDFY